MITRTIRRLTAAVFAIAVVGLALLMLAPALLGYERYIITTGSMTGSYAPGSIVYDEVVPTEQLRVGDAITYEPPAGSTPVPVITHRIVSITRRADGERVYRTKGDANRSADPWKFVLDQPTQARVAFSVPYLGNAVNALSERGTRMLLIGAPALLIAVIVLTRTLREARFARRGEANAQPRTYASLGTNL